LRPPSAKKSLWNPSPTPPKKTKSILGKIMGEESHPTPKAPPADFSVSGELPESQSITPMEDWQRWLKHMERGFDLWSQTQWKIKQQRALGKLVGKPKTWVEGVPWELWGEYAQSPESLELLEKWLKRQQSKRSKGP
jgi:hypothetical protein